MAKRGTKRTPTAEQKQAFDFLINRATTQSTFKKADLVQASGWSPASVTAYLSKQLRDYLDRPSRGVYRVQPGFGDFKIEQFLDLVTQVRHPIAQFSRSTYQAVLTYDFLLPLTREDKLRRALDALFYRDTLEARIRDAPPMLKKSFPPRPNETAGQYNDRLLDFINARIGGFSISHVSGRFRTDTILTRRESGDRLAADQQYLIDETTAVVRFILPCLAGRAIHAGDFSEAPSAVNSDEIEVEIRQMRGVFISIFVEAIVPTILGEKLIWMLETSPTGQRLYELSSLTDSS